MKGQNLSFFCRLAEKKSFVCFVFLAGILALGCGGCGEKRSGRELLKTDLIQPSATPIRRSDAEAAYDEGFRDGASFGAKWKRDHQKKFQEDQLDSLAMQRAAEYEELGGKSKENYASGYKDGVEVGFKGKK